MKKQRNKQINELHHKVIQLVYYFYSHHLFLYKMSISSVKSSQEPNAYGS